VTLFGIDISAHQDTTPPLDGLTFAVLRASIGGQADLKYATHYANCRKAGLVTMAYHYGYGAETVPIANQVAIFLQTAAAADYLWLDQEQAGFSDDEAQEFIDRVRETDRRCGLYHSSCGFAGVDSDGRWIADYRDIAKKAGAPMKCDGSAPWVAYDIWQRGQRADGIDDDRFNGSLAAFLRKGYVTTAQAAAATDAAYLRGQEFEWDRQFSSTNGAHITPLPRP